MESKRKQRRILGIVWMLLGLWVLATTNVLLGVCMVVSGGFMLAVTLRTRHGSTK